MTEGSPDSCECSQCQHACFHGIPGRFDPGQADKLAYLMGLTLVEMVDRYLAFDYWDLYDSGRVWMLKPAVLGMESKISPSRFIADYGTCVFFEEYTGKCKIHDIQKPAECVVAWCGFELEPNTGNDMKWREAQAARWDTPQEQERLIKLMERYDDSEMDRQYD